MRWDVTMDTFVKMGCATDLDHLDTPGYTGNVAVVTNVSMLMVWAAVPSASVNMQS